MHWFDVVIILIFIYSLFRGVKSGLIRSIFSLLGLVVSTGSATIFTKDFAIYLITLLPKWDKLLVNIFAFIIIWVIIYLIIYYLGEAISYLFHKTPLGLLDTLGGLLLGFAKGLLIVILSLMFCYSLPMLGTQVYEATKDSLSILWLRPFVDMGSNWTTQIFIPRHKL